jgi:serine/threonine protein kinase
MRNLHASPEQSAEGSNLCWPERAVVPAGPDSAMATRLVEQLTAAWESGREMLAEEVLADHPGAAEDRDLLIPLIYEEICLRQKAGQESASVRVLKRFPQWRTELELLVDCHHLLEADRPPLFPEVGERLGDFQLLAELGRGARGRVFLASQAALADRHVVCKVTPREGDEHLSLARLQHAHIVPLYFVQDFPQRHLQGLCMPYVGGLPLAAVLANLSPLPPAARDGRQFLNQIEQVQPPIPVPLPARGPVHRFLTRASSDQVVCWLGCCLADALHYAHERELVHLDVKPNNILLAADGQPMLLDFHLARAPLMPGEPAPGWLGGTPGYMAPEHEQALLAVSEGRPVPARVDGRADVYSLGLVLYEALGGPMPLPPHGSPRRLLRHNPRVSRGLADILAKCLKPDPARRYDSAAALAADLRLHLANQPLQGVPNRSWIERWRKWRRRSRAFSCSTLLMVLLLGAAAASLTRETFLIGQRGQRSSTDTLQGQQASSLLRREEPHLGMVSLDESHARQADDFWVHYYRGLYFYHLQRPRDALADFNACIALAPERSECYYIRALAHASLDQTESALRDYDQALQLEPHLARAAFNRGILHLQDKHYEQARADFQRALRDGVDPATIHYHLALVALAEGDPRTAHSHLEEALRYNPNHEQARRLHEAAESDPWANGVRRRDY